MRSPIRVPGSHPGGLARCYLWLMCRPRARICEIPQSPCSFRCSVFCEAPPARNENRTQNPQSSRRLEGESIVGAAERQSLVQRLPLSSLHVARSMQQCRWNWRLPRADAKAGYLQELGVTRFGLCRSILRRLKDDGYDIADYTSVHPSYAPSRILRPFSMPHMTESGHRGDGAEPHVGQHPWFQERGVPRTTQKRDGTCGAIRTPDIRACPYFRGHGNVQLGLGSDFETILLAPFF